MTGNDIVKQMAACVKDRAYVAEKLLRDMTNPEAYLEYEGRVRQHRRRLERFRSEAHVRFNGVQMSLADAEDLESAYETLEQLGFRNPIVVEELREIIIEGYKLPADED